MRPRQCIQHAVPTQPQPQAGRWSGTGAPCMSRCSTSVQTGSTRHRRGKPRSRPPHCCCSRHTLQQDGGSGTGPHVRCMRLP